MRRGEVAKVMYHLKDFGDVCGLFRSYAHRLKLKAQVCGGGGCVWVWVCVVKVFREEGQGRGWGRGWPLQMVK